MKHPRRSGIWFGIVVLLPVLLRGASPIDETKLPPPAPGKIDFARDIKPILAANCLRCHGPERPKSNFRLTERASALKGGANGVDIIPGKSAKSPLIHYTARLVPDMEMPPEGRGKPLSTNEVGLLRAWIDQGAVWDGGAAAESTPSITVSPMVGWTSVQGDQAKFRELEWRPEGWNGGMEDFHFRQRLPDGRSAMVESHVLRDDYKLNVELGKPDLGFTRFGFEQFRKYYDDGGGYAAALSPSLFRLGQEPYLDIGRAWTEVGLTLPNWPRIVAGYEYQYKDGSKSMLSWGPVKSPTGNFRDTRNIFPSVKDIDEHTHVVRLELSHDIHGFQIENKLRMEFHEEKTERIDAQNVSAGQTTPDQLTRVREENRYTQVADNVTLQKNLADWWLAGAGYRYSWLDGDTALRLTPQDGTGQLANGSAWSTDKILLSEIWQVFNAFSQFRPFANLTATLGVQGQWKRQQTYGALNLDEVIDPTDPTFGVIQFPAIESSTLDQTTAEESFLVRYGGLPFTSLYAEARLKQESYSRFAEQHGDPNPAPHDFGEGLDADVQWRDYRAGFTSSPLGWISFGGHYRHRNRDTDYAYPLARHDAAYPAFILSRAIVADEFETRAVIHAVTWLKTTLTYQLPVSDYRTRTGATSPILYRKDSTPGGDVFAGRYQAHVFNASATFAPFRQLYLSPGFSYQNSRTTTANNDSPSVAPYRGDQWSAQASASYMPNSITALSVSYVYSQARYAQNNAVAGLPLGLDYNRHGMQAGLERRFSNSVTGRLQYGYFGYEEPSSGNIHNYTAHQVMAVLHYRWR